MTKLPKKISPAIRLLDLTWEQANKEGSASYSRLNTAMRRALELAVGGCMPFDVGDIKHVLSNYRSGYWVNDSDEWIYTLAIACGNKSALKSYEAYAGRLPFIADDVQIESRSGFNHIGSACRQKERLCVGARFPWRGYRVEVTSFAKDQKYLTACYRPHSFPDDRKVAKRFKINRLDILEERAERKERKRLLDGLAIASADNGTRPAILEALGTKGPGEAARLPIKKVRAVAKKFGVA